MPQPGDTLTALLVLLLWAAIILNIGQATKTDSDDGKQSVLLWPNKQLNVLIDLKSLNQSERQTIETGLDQIQHKTCLGVNRLEANKVNPFDSSGRQLAEGEKNFIYIFKSHNGLYNRPPPMGLSTFGCASKGRQSVVLTEAAFNWPQIVLKYHLMRSLGVRNLTKPNEAQLGPILPLSQKISATQNGTSIRTTPAKQASAGSKLDDAMANYYAYATADGRPAANYLSDEDLGAIKQLYDCSDYQNRLSVKPLRAEKEQAENKGSDPPARTEVSSLSNNSSSLTAKKLRSAEESLRQIISSVAQEKGAQIDRDLIENAAKSIVHYLLAELEGAPLDPLAIRRDGQKMENLFDSLSIGQPCNGSSACPSREVPAESSRSHQERRSTKIGTDNEEADAQQRPMLLKLDSYHANDPQLKQANQMKLSQLNGSSDLVPPQTYRLLNQAPAPSQSPLDLYEGPGGSSQLQPQPPSRGKSEMMISFEQTPDARNPIEALAGSQVLKLCSCTCQTMGPTPSSPRPTSTSSSSSSGGGSSSAGTTEWPDQPTFETPATSPRTDASTKPSTKPMTTMAPPPPWTTTEFSASSSDTPTWPWIDPSSLTDEPDTEPWTPVWTQPSQKPTTTSRQPTRPESSTYPDTFTYAPTIKPTVTPTMLPWPPTTPPPPPTATTTTRRPTTTTSTTTSGSHDGNNGQTSTPAGPNSTTTSGGHDHDHGHDQEQEANWAACDQVQWVKPNKTIYSSAKIVWDVDRANQNYFLCNAQLDGELVPGKTHGLSCKVSSEGKAYELHQFQVLIKPESVNLAWVQKDSKSFGSKNLPVIGGYSRSAGTSQPDPYVVSRCLVRDENNDVITLIGYINRQNVGWFPFDDIQIECAQYDVLACVN